MEEVFSHKADVFSSELQTQSAPLGELHWKRANHLSCSSLLDTPFSGVREELALRPCSACLINWGIQYSLLSSCWVACSMEHKPCYREPCFKYYKPNCQAQQHISVMPSLGRQRLEGHLQCEASWHIHQVSGQSGLERQTCLKMPNKKN